jgi:hypothetical protein
MFVSEKSQVGSYFFGIVETEPQDFST